MLKLFIKSFFADLGNKQEWSILENRRFLKKQEIDVSKY